MYGIWKGIVVLMLAEWCLGANIRVILNNPPPDADTVAIAIDGKNLPTPLVYNRTPNKSSGTVFDLLVPDMPFLRVRAIALAHRGAAIFPSILSAVGMETDGLLMRTIDLNFAGSTIVARIGQIIDAQDGTAVVPVTWSAGKFFAQGAIVNLWVAPNASPEPASGTMFTAPLTSSSVPDVFTAVFKVPMSLTVSNRFQIGYHALDFRNAVEIPLLLIGAQYNGVGLEPSTNRPVRLTESEQYSRRGDAPEASLRPPGVYRVITGKDGRLVSVNTGTDTQKQTKASRESDDSKPPSGQSGPPQMYRRVIAGKDGRLVTTVTGTDAQKPTKPSRQTSDNKPPSAQSDAPQSEDAAPGHLRLMTDKDGRIVITNK